LGRNDLARRFFERAIELDPQSRRGYYGLGTALKRLGEMDKATASMKRFQELAIQQHNKTVGRLVAYDDLALTRNVVVKIHKEAAKAYRKRADNSKAESLWQGAAILDPKDVESRTELAALYEEAGKDREGLRVCEQLREIEPGRAEYWYNVGVIKGRLNQPDAAAAIKEAVKLDPGNTRYREAYEVLRKFQ
jgi:Flp pilus assembly protein TadD